MKLNPCCTRLLWLTMIVTMTSYATAQQTAKPLYLDMQQPLDKRVGDLIGRMTLNEKLLQLFNDAPEIKRLHVDAYNWWNESLHGVARAGKATVFPQAIGLAATFNEELMQKVATAISDEARAKHNFFIKNGIHSIYTGLTFWSPNLNIFRDPRWGRGQETYGEDPFLTGRMGVNFIRGLQGDDPRYIKVIATAKHYAVHSGPEFTRHQKNVFLNDRDLFETYLPAFRAAVNEGHVQSVMCAYNRFRDQPCCGSSLLLSNILRGRFGFKGYVTSDCGAISDFYNTNAHHVVESPQKALGWSLFAGTDLNCEENKAFLPGNIDSAVNAGIINEKDINVALTRLFRARFMLGMFDDPQKVIYNQIPYNVIGNKEHLALSEKAAEQSLVLLKNDGILPLKNIKTIALIGPNADNLPVLLGNYNGQPVAAITPLKAFTQVLGKDNVFYSPGSPIDGTSYTNYEIIDNSQLFHQENGKLIPGLAAEYYNNSNFGGIPAISRIDSSVDFVWNVAPITQKVEDQFSVMWKGFIVPAVSGDYLFGGNTLILIGDKIIEAQTPVRLEKGNSYKLLAKISVAREWWGNTILPGAQLSWCNTSIDYAKAAIECARAADVVVFCGGISPQLEGEEMPLQIEGFSHGDRTTIDLPYTQEALLKQLKLTGKKIIYINFSGSAVALNWETDSLNAIIQAFYPGEKTGNAVANIIFGKRNPSGRLPVTFYKSVADLPAFDDYNMAGRTYRYFTGEPLFPFGFGLSYSSFKYSNMRVSGTLICGQPVTVSFDITNTGNFDGNDVPQVYLKNMDTSLTSPLLSLVAFRNVFIKKGNTIHVDLLIKPAQMSSIDKNYKEVILPSQIKLYVSQQNPYPKTDLKNCLIKLIQLRGRPYFL